MVEKKERNHRSCRRKNRSPKKEDYVDFDDVVVSREPVLSDELIVAMLRNNDEEVQEEDEEESTELDDAPEKPTSAQL